MLLLPMLLAQEMVMGPEHATIQQQQQQQQKSAAEEMSKGSGHSVSNSSPCHKWWHFQ